MCYFEVFNPVLFAESQILDTPQGFSLAQENLEVALFYMRISSSTSDKRPSIGLM